MWTAEGAGAPKWTLFNRIVIENLIFVGRGPGRRRTHGRTHFARFSTRFQQEVDQIQLKNSIGGDKKNKKDRYRSRMDVIKLTIETETNEFEGCGLEMPNLLDEEDFKYFKNWNGELRFLQNIGLKRFRKEQLSNDTQCLQNMEEN